MSKRFLVIGTVVGALVLFVWGFIANAALPIYMSYTTELTAENARAIRAIAPENGIYFAKEGVYASVFMTPDMADLTSNEAMGPAMGKQMALNLVVALAMVLMLGRLRAESPMHTAMTFAVAGLAAGLLRSLSMHIWYGFTFGHQLFQAVDTTIAFALTGLVLRVMYDKWGRPAGMDAAEAPGVRAEGGLPSAGVGTRV